MGSIRRECCNYCMWYGPVNKDGTMRKHRPATNDDKWGRPNKVQDMTAPPCPGSNKPFVVFNTTAQTSPATESMEQSMTEYGVFNDEGCIYVADTLAEAEAEAAKERAVDDGYWADLISVHEMCADHRDQEQPKDGCEECATEPPDGNE
ncbi:hypothetical protein N4G70_28700 [Streptomyces sp. ASQP_92]|uniref:hypothetical protein n=1 Tax=Streptomyces sp. ASQP_92 TaxID=2979116 RepID=UPI0021C00AC1|nr:hypothetical protein [Streptomyces sp. ASQP_92]MCT9092820.1 hypothetical protein [Streptomyces sp. ASQP_92]